MKATFTFLIVLVIGLLLSETIKSQNVSGVYKTDFNEMTLQQNGSQVTGTYKYSDGRIEGTIYGNTMTGWWYQSNGKGRFSFVFNSDFSAFTGKWGHESAEPSGTWNGTKTSGFSSATYSHINVSGTYNTDFNEMTLQQTGSQVTGTYKHSGGRVEGTLNGNTLTGWWYQSNGKGRLVFVFNSDYSAFSGKWGYDDAEPTSAWNGKKINTGNTVSSSPASNTPTQLPPAEGEVIFNNWNKAAVDNNASGTTYFYLSRNTTITRITNYHWNYGSGKPAGQIGLKGPDGRYYGPWSSIATSGTGGAQNVNWIASPNISITPGLYQVTDSDVSTWSNNSGSFGCGFTTVQGK